MTISYFCNNVDDPNWGCRATSLALYERIARPGEPPVRTFSRSFSALPVVLSRLPSRLYGRTRSGVTFERARATPRHGARVQDAAYHLCERLDIIGLDPARNAQRMRRIAAWHPEVARALEAIETSDHVVINGEGGMIFRSPPRRDLLFQMTVAFLAQQAGVPVYYVNAIVSPCPATGVHDQTLRMCLEVLAQCTAVALRDPMSLEFLRNAGYDAGNDALVPDALFSWSSTRTLSPAAPTSVALAEPWPERPEVFAAGGRDDLIPETYVCISGASQPSDQRDGWTEQFTDLVERVRARTGYAAVLVVPCRGDSFLHDVGARTGAPVVRVETNVVVGASILANAAAFVSGRYHPSIMAALGGTPLVHFASNSHKLQGLRSLLRDEDTALSVPGDPSFAKQLTVDLEAALDDPQRARRRARAAELGAETISYYEHLIPEKRNP